jgi:dTDP-4-amino-4,6-dideoxygalactose transaminase
LAAIATGLKVARIPANTLPLTAIGLMRGGARILVEDIGHDGRLKKGGPDFVPVLLFGRMPNESEIASSLFDAAHAHGWQPPASAVACWSIYPTKSLGAFGDAGAVTTNDQNLAKTMRALMGADDRLHDGRQITSRMDEVQAAILRIKLRLLPEWLDQRRHIAGLYRRMLPESVVSVSTNEADLHHLYVIRTPRRDALKYYLEQQGVETKVHFPDPLHRQTAPWGRPDDSLPSAEAWCDSILTLPCYPGLKVEEVQRVCELTTGLVFDAPAPKSARNT